MPPPTASGMNSSRATAANRVGERLASLERGRDVEDDELVDPFRVVSARELGRIAGRSQLLEVDAFDDLPVANVEAGDDAFGEHLAVRQPQEVPQDREPDLSGLFRMELHAGDTAALHDRRRTARPCTVTATVSSVIGAAKLCVKYTCDPDADAFDNRVGAADVERVPSDVRNLDRRAVEFRVAADNSVRESTRDRAAPGASSLPSNSHCMPRQMPSSGRPGIDALRDRVRVHSSASVAVAPKWPTPGTTTAPARVELARLRRARRDPRRPQRTPSSPTSSCRRDSRSVRHASLQQSLRAGQHPREPAVLRAGDAQRAGERLEHRLDVMVARSPVQHLHVHVRARADGKPSKKS